MYISSYRDTRSGIRVKAIIKEYFGRQSVYFVKNDQINKIEIAGVGKTSGITISQLSSYDPEKIYAYNRNFIGNWGPRAKLTLVFDDEQVDLNGKPLPNEWFEDSLFITWSNLNRFQFDADEDSFLESDDFETDCYGYYKPMEIPA